MKAGHADLVAKMDRTGNVDAAFKEVQQRQRIEARKAEAKEAAAQLPPDDFGVRVGDFREVAQTLADGSVDLIFTDRFARRRRRPRCIPGSAS